MCYFNSIWVNNREHIRLRDLSTVVKNDTLLKHLLVDGFTYSQYPVLKANRGEKKFDLTAMEWGFLPSPNKWPFVKTREDANRMRFGYKDSKGDWKPGITTLNAVGEELLFENKMYRDAALNRRCLVLSSGFYEWRHIHRLNKKTGEPLKTPDKYPYYISIPGQEYFYMAGIYNPWTDKSTGETVDTFAIVTTEANFLMKQIHNSKNRMPTILNEELAYEWMFSDMSEKRITEIATSQFPWQQMDAYTIAKDFKSAVNPKEPFEYDKEIVSPLNRVAA
ncbi:MAG: SOS response-associated peptidase family protein [Bacteroidetes bacterium]|nr:SOS response-associated peptidase family protein [Bacteroidota bacterium]